MRDRSSIEANISRLYVITALRWFMLIIPVVVLFYRDNGLTMSQVMLLQAVFSIVLVVAEVPSGYVSDIIGRRFSIVLGTTLTTLGWGCLSISVSFWHFLGAEVLLGAGVSFISGTDSALLYDSLLQSGRRSEYMQAEGRLISTGNFAEGAASVLGGFAAAYSLRLPLYIQIVLVAATIPIALTLREPAKTRKLSRSAGWRDLVAVARFALMEHREIQWLILYSSLVATSTLTMVWLIQPYLEETGLPLAAFGIVWAVLQFSTGLFSLNAHRFERAVGRKKALVSLIFLCVAAYALLALFQTLWAAVFILMFYFVRGIGNPIVRTYINDLISSDRRATVLSIRNMVSRFFFTLIAPGIGWITDVYSLGHALTICALLFIFSGVVFVAFLFKYKVV